MSMISIKRIYVKDFVLSQIINNKVNKKWNIHHLSDKLLSLHSKYQRGSYNQLLKLENITHVWLKSGYTLPYREYFSICI